MLKSRFWKSVIIVAVLSLAIVAMTFGIVNVTGKKARLVEASSDAYARYDSTANQISMGTDKVKRTIILENGIFMTSELTDVVANKTYVNSTTKQIEFNFTVNGVNYRSDATNGGNWTYVSHNSYLDTQKELVFDFTVKNSKIQVTKTYIIYPGTSIIQEKATIKNISGGNITLASPGIFDRYFVNIDGANSDFYYMTGNANYSGASMLKNISLASDYYRLFDSYNDKPEVQEIFGFYQDICVNDIMGAGKYNEFFALRNRSTQNGVFVLFDYQGAWTNSVNYSNGVLAMDGRVQMSAFPMANGESVATPLTLTGFWTGDIDDMGNTLGEYQANYKWDYTDEENLTPRTTQWVKGRQTDNAFELAQLARYIGSGTVHIDDSWYDKSGDWNNTNNDDFRAINEFVKKNGGPGITVWSPIWQCYYQSELIKEHPDWIVENWNCGGCLENGGGYGSHLRLDKDEVVEWAIEKLISMQEAWGSYMWRYDAEPVALINGSCDYMLKASNNYYRLVKEFRDRCEGESVHGCSSGGMGMTIEGVRYVTVQQITDGGVGKLGNYYLSLLFPSMKLQMGDLISGYNNKWSRKNLANINEAVLDTPFVYAREEWYNEEELELQREYLEMFHYLTNEKIRSKDSKYYRPLATYNGINNYGTGMLFQQMNKDCTRGIIYINEWTEVYESGKSFIIYPKGLKPSYEYTIESWERQVTSKTMTGAEWMAQGILVNKLVPGETIFLNLQNRPGAGSDKQAPTTPTNLTVKEATYLQRSGIELNWTASTDNTMVSYYNIYRNGKYVDRVAQGTFYFAKNGSVYDNWQITAVDGDDNESSKLSLKEDIVENENKYGTLYDFGPQGRRGWAIYESTNGAKKQSLNYIENNKLYKLSDGGWIKNDMLKLLSNDVVFEWTAQKTGYVNIYGEFAKYYASQTGNGVLISLYRNQKLLYNTMLGAENINGITFNRQTYINKGEKLSICLQTNGNANGDKFFHNFLIEYMDVSTEIAPTSVTFAEKDLNTIIAVGQQLSLPINILPYNTTLNQLEYSVVSGAEYLTISADGVITAKSTGKVTIKVTSAYNKNLTDTITIDIYDLDKVYNSQRDFSSQQGSRNWYYMSAPYGNISVATQATFDTVGQKWIGAEELAQVEQYNQHPGNEQSSIRMFLCPYNGTVSITRSMRIVASGGNGVIAKLVHINTSGGITELKSTTITDLNVVSDNTTIQVTKGDKIYFVLENNGSASYDATEYIAEVVYQNSSSGSNNGEIVLELQNKTNVITVGEFYKVNLTTNPTSLVDNIVWSIEGEDVIGFDKTTQSVIGLKEGVATLVATSADGIVVEKLGIVVQNPIGTQPISMENGFSNEQGKNNWYYAYAISGTSDFKRLTSYSNDLWSGENWLRLGAIKFHPQLGFDVAKIYQVKNDAQINLSGIVKKSATEGLGGDGVKVSILLNGTSVWTQTLSGDNVMGVGYNFNLSAKANDTISYVVNCLGAESLDTTLWYGFTMQNEVAPLTEKVQGLIVMIEQLPQVDSVSLQDQANINNLMQLYNSLTTKEKALVTNGAKLLSCELKVKEIALYKEQVNRVFGLIEQLGDKFSQENVYLARGAYDSLTEQQKTEITNYNKLVVAEQNLEQNNLNLVYENQALAVKSLIKNFNLQNLTIKDKEMIVNIRQQYNNLSQSAKNFVSVEELDKLTQAEEKITYLTDLAQAQSVEILIELIPNANSSKYTEALNAYNALTEEQKVLVSDYYKQLLNSYKG